jgi:Tfp pilus assembly protein PilN
MKAVNLLPKDAYAPRQRLPHARIVLAGTLPVLAAALVYLGYSLEHAQVTDRQNELGLVQSQIAALGPSRALVDESTRVNAEKTSRAAAVQAVLDKRVAWDVLLPRVARVTPGGAWYTSLSASSPTPTAAATATAGPSLTLQGYAPTQTAVAQLLARLPLVPGVGAATLTSSTSSTVGTKTLFQFSIQATLTGGAS